MKDELITFDTAKLAKEKGFNWDVSNAFVIRGKRVEEEDSYHYNHNGTLYLNPLKDNTVTEIISRPTQSLLQRWLREEHDIHIVITTGEFFKNETETAFWGLEVSIIGAANASFIERDDFEGTYEQALEKGLYQALLLIKT